MSTKTAARLILCFTLILISCFSANAQKKHFTEEQLLKNKMPAILVAMPSFVSWDDDAHLVYDKRTLPDTAWMTTTIDATTGKELISAKDYSRKQGSAMQVLSKENDLYYSNEGVLTRLTNNIEEEKNPRLSPDKKLVAFTRKNNLYVVDVATKTESQLTTDGTEDILNGYASWVYFEEILGHEYTTFWWSPDSKQIAFFRTDESAVPVFTLTDATGQHGLVVKQRYPKAGDKNPEVRVGIVSIENKKIKWADFNEHDDQYFGRLVWGPESHSVFVTWMNRAQNNMKIYEVSPATGKKKEVYNEAIRTWIRLDNSDRLTVMKSGKGMIILSDINGWRHIYYYNSNGKLINAITSGNYPVTELKYYDEKNETLYFTACKENSARTDLYSATLDGKKITRLTFGDYNHFVTLSPSRNYFITTYNNISTPTRIALLDRNGKLVKEIADSKGPEFDNYHFSKTEIIKVKSEDGLYDLPVLIRWPMELDPEKRYPVIVDIYGGPNSNSVNDFWSYSRTRQWFAKEGLIYVSIDHRGSAHFGKGGSDNMYRNLGYWEIKDYSTVVKWLINKGYADSTRIAIQGYSYGGYLACYALTYGADVFTHGMAGSSVTDWSLYDTHYVERYMGTPANNPEGYKSSSVLTHTDKYKGRLLFSHGVMDDNVHMQNSALLVSKLQDRRKDFDFSMYSEGTHGDLDLNKQMHFQNIRISFIYKYLLLKPVPAGLLR
jgi:dipeptidyl-peptidase 4